MKLIDCILCDDIRQEAGGKQSLMGVYDEILRIQMPEKSKKDSKEVAIRLCVYLRVAFDLNEEIGKFNQLELIVSHGESNLVLGKGPVKQPEDDDTLRRVTLSAVIPKFPINEKGKIEIKINFFDRNGEKSESISSESIIELV